MSGSALGTLELIPSTSNSFTGGLTLSSGTLVFNNNSALGASSGTITLAGGTLIPTTAVTLTNPLVQSGRQLRPRRGEQPVAIGRDRDGSPWSRTPRSTSANYTGTATLAGVVSGAGLTITGITGFANNLGQVILSNANTYIGGTAVSGGVLTIGNNSALGIGTLTMTGGTVQTDGNPRTLTNALSLGATGAGVQLDGVLNFTGTGVLTALSNLVVNGTTTLAGPISGAFALSQSGTGTLQLTAPDTYTGATTVYAGTVILGGNGTILGSTSLVVNQGGALTLDNNTGGLNNPNRIADTATLTLNGGTFNYTGNTTAPSTETIGTIILNSGASVLTLSGLNSTLTSGGLTRPNTGASLSYMPAAVGTQQLLFTGGTPAPIGAGTPILPFVRVISGATASYANVVGGVLVAVPPTATETIGAAGVSDNVSLPAADSETLVAGTNPTINSLTVPSGATINLNGNTLTITSGGILNYGGSGAPVTFTNGTVFFGVGATTDGIVFNTNGGSITFGANALLAGTGGLTVGGNGTVNVNGVNTFTGGTFLTGGILEPGQ